MFHRFVRNKCFKYVIKLHRIIQMTSINVQFGMENQLRLLCVHKIYRFGYFIRCHKRRNWLYHLRRKSFLFYSCGTINLTHFQEIKHLTLILIENIWMSYTLIRTKCVMVLLDSKCTGRMWWEFIARRMILFWSKTNYEDFPLWNSKKNKFNRKICVWCECMAFVWLQSGCIVAMFYFNGISHEKCFLSLCIEQLKFE